jgi:hypothetical protein
LIFKVPATTLECVAQNLGQEGKRQQTFCNQIQIETYARHTDNSTQQGDLNKKKLFK